MKKILLYAVMVIAAVAACVAYMVHGHNERMRYNDMEGNHISIVNKIIRSNEIDVEGIKAMKEAIAGEEGFEDYDKALDLYLDIADRMAQSDADKCPVTITVSAKGPAKNDSWNATVAISNTSDKQIKKVDFEIVADNAAGETVECKEKTKCRWKDMKPGTTAKCGYWTVYMEHEMKAESFRADKIQIEFEDGTTWPGVPECLQHVDELKEAFNKCFAPHKKG